MWMLKMWAVVTNAHAVPATRLTPYLILLGLMSTAQFAGQACCRPPIPEQDASWGLVAEIKAQPAAASAAMDSFMVAGFTTGSGSKWASSLRIAI